MVSIAMPFFLILTMFTNIFLIFTKTNFFVNSSKDFSTLFFFPKN